MPLDTEVDLIPGHIVLDGDPTPTPPRKGAQQPPLLFSADVCCGHGRPSQLLLSSCKKLAPCGRLLVSGFQALVTLTLTFDRVTGLRHTVVHYSSSSVHVKFH